MKPQLTKKQSAIYAYMRERFPIDQRMPSIRDLMAEFHISSPNGIHCHLKALALKGYITIDANTARGIKFTGVRVVLEEIA